MSVSLEKPEMKAFAIWLVFCLFLITEFASCSWPDPEGGFSSFVVLGRTTLPGTGHEVKFDYSWGQVDSIIRAPWEGKNVPAKRYVGPGGTSFSQ